MPSPYGVHPGIAMEQSVLRHLEHKTGRSLAQWVELAQAHGPAEEKERAVWLKTEHRLGRHTAAWLAARSLGRGRRYDADALVEAMFSGRRAPLRPLYDQVVKLCLGLGRDVTVTPCKSAVPVRRRRVFAEVLPGTRTHSSLGLALGLALGELPSTSRLELRPSARRDPRITHRVSLHRPDDLDDQLLRWLKSAYDRAL